MRARFTSIIAALGVVIGLLVLAGCSGGGASGQGGTSTVTQVEVPVPGPTVYVTGAPTTAPTPSEPHAKIVFTFPSVKGGGKSANGIAVTQYRFVGYDGGGTVHYGPVTYPAAPQITLENVPVSIVGIVIETISLTGSVDDTRHTTTQLQEGETRHIDDPITTGSPLDGLAVVPGRASVARGTSVAFQLQGVFADGVTQDLTRTAAWSCANSTVAQMRDSQSAPVGMVTGLTAGETDVQATYARRLVTGHLVVRDTTVTRLDVTPATASLGVDTAVPMTALAHLADGTAQDVTSDATWTSSTPTVARVLNQLPNAGLVIGIAGGDTQITAAFGGATATASIHVTGAALTSITVTPGVARVSKGLTQQFTAIGTYADSSTADLTNRVSWSTSDGSVASVTSGGAASGLANGLSVGTVTVTATYGDQSGSASLEVTQAQVVSLVVSAPRSAVVLGDTVRFTATATFTDTTSQDVSSQALWRSSNGSVASLVGSTATGAGVGAVTVTAGYRGATASASLTVVQGVANGLSISTPQWWVGVGESLSLVGSVLLPSGAVQLLGDAAAWASSAPAVATVTSPAGLLTGVAPGLTTVSLSDGTHGSVTTPVRVISSGEVVSRTSAGDMLTSGFSDGGTVSADGRYVAFRSMSYGMVPGGFNGQSDIYVRDRLLDTLERVSVDSNGVEANDYCLRPVISADGNTVAFISLATNLGPGPVFVRNRSLGTTVSVGADGGNPIYFTLSDDGRYLNLGGMRYDLRNNTHTRTPDCMVSRISGNGRFVVYESGTPSQVYIVDVDGATAPELVSATPFGTPGNNQSQEPYVSTDGRFVVFQSDASDLVTGDTNGFTDIFIRDRLVGVTERVSLATDGSEGDRRSYAYHADLGPAGFVSADGRYVVFSSLATNFDSTNNAAGYVDVFIRDRVSGTTGCLTPISGDATNPSPRAALGDICASGASADARFVTFDSRGWGSITGPLYNGDKDVFLIRSY